MKEIIDFIRHGESIKLRAYIPVNGDRWTIGMGNTFYEDGSPVKEGDVITLARAYALGEYIVNKFTAFVKQQLTRPVTQNQLIALVSMAYNVGEKAFKKSIILKMVNANPNDPAIKEQFPKSFITVDGVLCNGLVNRRQSELKKYLTV